MVVAEMYCREQITIPEQLPLILKKYAKAVIRTQPYDILRWSAAYFRCLALEQFPPTKLRFEPEQKYGSVTRGYIRTLLEQLGKGYFVRRKLLLNRWQGLCLPEEQLYDFLALCRMMNWPHVHWLKLVAVMIGALNEDLMSTMKMICEVLTDEPEGSPAPIPLWMFRVCYKFIAELDCSETQCFIDGRKLLPGDLLEDEEDPIEAPQVHSAAVFQQLLIDEWKSRIKYDQFSAPAIESANVSDTESTTDVTESGSVISRVSSSFKFVGNFADPAEVLRRAPDFDSVILLLQEEIDNIHQVSPSESVEQMLERAKLERKERKIRETCDKNAETSYEAQEQERMNVLKKIGPPWAWLHKFADFKCPKQSFNFIDINSSPIGSEDEELAYDLTDIKKDRCTSAESSQTIIHFSGDSRSRTFIYEESSSSSSRVNSATVIGEVLSDVMCKLNEAQSNGKCSVRDVRSLTRIISTEFPNNENAEKFKGYLDKANATGKDFNDLNELNSYFMGEVVKEKAKKNNEDDGNDDEDPNETLKDCDEPDKIVEIFEESGIDVDNKLLEKKVSETMILGLVKKPESLQPPTSDVDVESVKSIQSDDTTTASVVSSGNKITKTGTKDETIQTTPYLERQRQKMAEEAKQQKSKEEPWRCEAQAEDLHKSIIPPLPGIGGSVSHETSERFLLYLMRRARQQGGMIYPRNWQETECPPMID